MKDALAYMKDQGLQDAIHEAIKAVLLEKPDNPVRRIGQLLISSAPTVSGGYGGSHCNVAAYFTIKDFEAAKPGLDACVDSAKSEPGVLYYGWTICGEKLFCRQTFVDGAAAAQHLKNELPILSPMLESGCISVDSWDVMGAEADLAAAKKAGDGVGASYWEVWDSWNHFKHASSVTPATQSFLTLQQTFKILDMKGAAPLMAKCLEVTKSEAGCMYYGWAICGDKLFCREAYVSGDAVNAHVGDSLGHELIAEMLEKHGQDGSPAVAMDKVELHGPREQLEIATKTCDGLGSAYWEEYASFSRFTMYEWEENSA